MRTKKGPDGFYLNNRPDPFPYFVLALIKKQK